MKRTRALAFGLLAGCLCVVSATSGSAQRAPSRNDSFLAFDDLDAALQSGGLNRDRYQELLRQTLPRVMAYLNQQPKDASLDTLLAMGVAAHQYQSVVRHDTWPRATTVTALARQYVAYARDLSQWDTPGHVESTAPQALTRGQALRGRIGAGDLPLPAELGLPILRPPGVIGPRLNASPSDIYDVNIASQASATFEVVGGPCELGVAIEDLSNGKRLAYKSGIGSVRVRKTLKPGEYRLWVAGLGGIGAYRVVFR